MSDQNDTIEWEITSYLSEYIENAADAIAISTNNAAIGAQVARDFFKTTGDVADIAVAGIKASHAGSETETRIDGMYVDKLDGKISEAFFEQKAGAWREEQKTILAKIEAMQNASQIYIEEGIQLLELAQNAHFLFVKQSAHEKRRLLNFLVSSCIWKDGVLAVKFKQPFDMLSEFVVDLNDPVALKGRKTAQTEKWLLE